MEVLHNQKFVEKLLKTWVRKYLSNSAEIVRIGYLKRDRENKSRFSIHRSVIQLLRNIIIKKTTTTVLRFTSILYSMKWFRKQKIYRLCTNIMQNPKLFCTVNGKTKDILLNENQHGVYATYRDRIYRTFCKT